MNNLSTITKPNLFSLIYEIKQCISTIGTAKYKENPDKIISEQIDNAMIGLEIIDKVIGQTSNQFDQEWHFTSDNIFPKENEYVLFATKTGSVSEGFFQKKDPLSMRLNADNKIEMENYPSGGKWYRAVYRDLLDVSDVYAWRYKPAAPKR